MFATSNTQRTLDYLRKCGFKVGIVERFLSYAGKFGQRKDLFNIIDIIAIAPYQIVGVQSTGQGFSEHHNTIINCENTLPWLETGSDLVLFGWRKVKKERGGKVMIWKPRIRLYHLEYDEGTLNVGWEDIDEYKPRFEELHEDERRTLSR